ncbi:MAG: bifunctional folylpolyglutamate synthase/dihydrofolate synthase [Alphaproteobacteria bacterium]|nr:bifunctional folylpolyglutamate synthase/dihydrofolate synthase [Alphaproteobacteria bacterium]
MSTSASDDLLARLAGGFPRVVELSLRPAYFDLLRHFGDPQNHLPPVFHVAGTNGKGSTCAFLRAMLEAAGQRVHVYTSPHLVHFHERIRLAGQLIDEPMLVDLLREVERVIVPGTISQFEATTAAAFAAFARTPADYLILETGLGGRFDATNIVAKPLASLISRISFDHREFLGDTLIKIAGEKAGIIKPGVHCFIGQQFDDAVDAVFCAEAEKQQAKLYHYGQDWHTSAHAEGFVYRDAHRALVLPSPALLGAHQVTNASLAIATLRHTLPHVVTPDQYAQGLRQVHWPARLQRLQAGKLAALLPPDWELWLDGGHNDSAGEVLAEQAAAWRADDGAEQRPLYVIYGMIKSKVPSEFLAPLQSSIAAIHAVAIPDTPSSLSAEEALDAANVCGLMQAQKAESVSLALHALARLSAKKARVLICGSLYLAGHVLAENG